MRYKTANASVHYTAGHHDIQAGVYVVDDRRNGLEFELGVLLFILAF
jgi:hypothetical protein